MFGDGWLSGIVWLFGLDCMDWSSCVCEWKWRLRNEDCMDLIVFVVVVVVV